MQRDPRLVDVRRVALGADPPDRSAVDLLLRGRRHVRLAGQRSQASGETARDPAPQQQRRAPARETGVGGGRDTMMMEGGREGGKSQRGWKARGGVGGDRCGDGEGEEERSRGTHEEG